MEKIELLFEEDDCAPDARSYFKQQFLEYMGQSIEEWTKDLQRTEIDDLIKWEKDSYTLYLEPWGYSFYKEVIN